VFWGNPTALRGPERPQLRPIASLGCPDIRLARLETGTPRQPSSVIVKGVKCKRTGSPESKKIAGLSAVSPVGSPGSECVVFRPMPGGPVGWAGPFWRSPGGPRSMLGRVGGSAAWRNAQGQGIICESGRRWFFMEWSPRPRFWLNNSFSRTRVARANHELNPWGFRAVGRANWESPSSRFFVTQTSATGDTQYQTTPRPLMRPPRIAPSTIPPTFWGKRPPGPISRRGFVGGGWGLRVFARGVPWGRGIALESNRDAFLSARMAPGQAGPPGTRSK